MSTEQGSKQNTTNEIMGNASNAGGKIAKTGARAATKGARKLAASAAKKAGALAVKGVAALGKALLVLLKVALPVILVILAFILLIVVIDYFSTDSRGASQEYDYTELEAENEYSNITDEYGDLELVSISEENAFLQIYYQNEVESSYWMYYKDGKDTVLDFAGNDSLFKPEVKDKYGREDFFLLSAMNLYALEEYLNDNNAVTPQTFIQHVPFEEKDGNITGVPLVEDDKLTIKSHAFEYDKDSEDGEPVFKKKYDENDKPVFTEGVWDYGLAPVYHYEEFVEKVEFRNSITGAETWDIETQKMRPMTPEELHDFVNNDQTGAYKEWSKEFDAAEGHSKTKQGSGDINLVVEEEERVSWMIRDAVTPMGTIKNEIEQTWQPTGAERTEVQNITMSVPIEKEREVQDTDEDGNKLWYEVLDEARYRRKREPLNNTGSTHHDGYKPIFEDPSPGVTRFAWGYAPEGFPQIPTSPDKEGSIRKDIPDGWELQWRKRTTDNHVTKNNGDDKIVWTTEIYHELEERTHSVETKGVEWEYIPRYVGEPDTSELSGLKYYREYFAHYENYVPEDSVGISPFDILKEAREEEAAGVQDGTYGLPPTVEERKDGEKAKSIKPPYNVTPEHPLMKEIRDLQIQHINASSSASVDLSGIDFGAETDSTAVQNASEFIDIFVKYGNMYGVDPMMVLAVSAHESNGRHYARANEYQSHTVRRSYDYAGNGYADLSAIGLMQVRPLHGRNPSKPRDVRAYNHEQGQMETFKATAQELHDVDTNIKFATMLLANEIKNADYDVLVGIASYHYGARFEQFVRTSGLGTWSINAEQAYVDAGNAGTPGFVPNVLKYYLPTEGNTHPWALTNDGEKRINQVEGVDFATEDAINVNLTDSLTKQRRGGTGSVSKGARELQKAFASPYKGLARAGVWMLDSISEVTNYFGWTTSRDESEYYRVGKEVTTPTEQNLLIHTMLAYEEGLHVHEYEAMTEEDFEERFLESFLHSVRQQENIGLQINPKEFFPDGHQSPVKDVNISVEFGESLNSKHFKGIQLDVPGATKIYAVADGVVSELNKHNVTIDHGDGVETQYRLIGEVTIMDKYEVGDEIKKGTVIGMGAANTNRDVTNNSFVFMLKKSGREMDPTWIVDPSVLVQSGNLGIDPNAGHFQHPYFGQNYTYTSPYGYRIHPIYGTRKLHAGTDLAGIPARANAPIGSVADGVVFAAQWSNGWGNNVVIHHDHIDLGNGANVYSLYAHMRSPSPLSPGQRVSAGDIVGNEGTTGGSTGDHLHLEFIVGHGTNPYSIRSANIEANTVDPRPYID